jgi:hypothetical protein
MLDERDSIIIEFITKLQGLAYDNKFGVCCLCGGGKEITDENFYKPRHLEGCLFLRAEQAVIKLANT